MCILIFLSNCKLKFNFKCRSSPVFQSIWLFIQQQQKLLLSRSISLTHRPQSESYFFHLISHASYPVISVTKEWGQRVIAGFKLRYLGKQVWPLKLDTYDEWEESKSSRAGSESERWTQYKKIVKREVGGINKILYQKWCVFIS